MNGASLAEKVAVVSCQERKVEAEICVTGERHWAQQGSCEAHQSVPLQCCSYVLCQITGSSCSSAKGVCDPSEFL